jgi:methionyl-tRNA formyltransferase
VRVILFGTPAFAVPTLAGLLASSHAVVAVVTQPDRPRGRGQRVTASPVKALAETRGIPVLQPDRLRDASVADQLGHFRADIAVVAAYGKILPQRLLDLPAHGIVNVHASLLPRWRGAAPIHRAVMAGDAETGVTIMRVVAALDAGPMLAKTIVPIGANETSAELEPRVAEAGATLLLDTLERLERGPVPEEPQDEHHVTYAARLERAESQIDWARPAREIHNRIRGLQPWPMAAAMLQGRRLLLTRAEVADAAASAGEPGVIVEVDGDAVVVAASPGLVRIREVKPEGRPPMPVRAFLNGRRVAAGERFEALPPSS